MNESDIMSRDEFAELLRKTYPEWTAEEGVKALTHRPGVPTAPCLYVWPDGQYLITVVWDLDRVTIGHGFQREVWRALCVEPSAEKIVASIGRCWESVSSGRG